MKAFAYVAFTGSGDRRTGSVVAETETAAAAQLEAQGLFVSNLTAKAREKRWQPRRAALTGDLQTVFTRQMAVLLGADMPVEAALQAVGQGGHKALETVAARARAQLMDGARLSESLKASGAGFPSYVVASIEAGERAGDLAAVFSELADFLERQGEDKAVIGTALIYPAFVAVVSLIVCAILMVSVAPEIVAMFALTGQPLPPITQAVLAVSDWAQANVTALGLVGASGLVLVAATRTVPTVAGLKTRVALRLPVVRRFMAQEAAVQYLRTLALVLASRNTVPNAVDSAAGVLDIAQFQSEGRAVQDAISRGQSLSQAFSTLSFVPPVAHQLIQAGEASARLAQMADRAAQMVEHGLITERKRIAAILEPVLMMIVGAMVLVIVLAVLLPIFDLQAAVG